MNKTRKKLDSVRHMPYNDPVDTTAIRQRRQAMGMTTNEAAQRAGWSKQWWSDIEHGSRRNPRISTLLVLARVLGCGVEDLIRKEVRASLRAFSSKSTKRAEK